ncbi:MAG: DUF4157 domain-containing protein [Gemmatimonadales bacterium]
MRQYAKIQNTPQGTDSVSMARPRHATSGHAELPTGFAMGARAVSPVVADVLNSRGQPLQEKAQVEMGQRFGYDFSGVRVHSDSRAAESARLIGARAYTLGRHVVFAASEYRPGSAAGKRLLAHELTHVLQQQGSAFALEPEVVRSSRIDRFELEATVTRSS